MPRYRVHRIKETPKENFRWSAHTGGLAIVKPKDYDPGNEMESFSPYTLWKELQASASPDSEPPLSPGDVLEAIGNDGSVRLFIAKYIGFEPAQWYVPELKAAASHASPTDDATAPEPEKALQS